MNAQIKHMVDRFLGWKLPADFSPDGGIGFQKVSNAGTPHEYRYEPVGTNLLTATQATAMVEHMLEGVSLEFGGPQALLDVVAERRRQVESEGWTPEHDDEHTDGSLALAAVCYATPVKLYSEDRRAGGPAFFDPWPSSWHERYDKRFRYGERRTNPGNSIPDPATYTDTERRDLLVKAGALILAEIDRLDRAAATSRLAA